MRRGPDVADASRNSGCARYLHAMKQGKSNKLIAYGLNMTESTVKSHIVRL